MDSFRAGHVPGRRAFHRGRCSHDSTRSPGSSPRSPRLRVTHIRLRPARSARYDQCVTRRRGGRGGWVGDGTSRPAGAEMNPPHGHHHPPLAGHPKLAGRRQFSALSAPPRDPYPAPPDSIRPLRPVGHAETRRRGGWVGDGTSRPAGAAMNPPHGHHHPPLAGHAKLAGRRQFSALSAPPRDPYPAPPGSIRPLRPVGHAETRRTRRVGRRWERAGRQAQR
jgi:hypothetical protein